MFIYLVVFLLDRNVSARRAASRAFAATSRTIQEDAAPPTSARARVMGVESVVEGVAWDLSSEQLKVEEYCTRPLR